jgi:acetamidase/formamidase
MATHIVEPERKTLHGHFSRDLPPALTIDSGDTVIFRTLDAGWTVEQPASVDDTPKKFEPRVEALDGGHSLCGPVAVSGAQPGMTLEIGIEAIQVGTWGWGGSYRGDRNEKLDVPNEGKYELFWELDSEEGTGRSQHGHTVALKPFMGVMGMPPADPGIFSTGPPRNSGGNLDCKELVAGTTLFLPIPVPGALFSVGDGHAIQGDGEVSGVAIECPMEKVELTFKLRDDLTLSAPRVRVEGGWLTLGLHEDLNEATFLALKAMLDLMCEQMDMGRKEALALASLVVDMRITQIVNGTCGVHAFLADGALK